MNGIVADEVSLERLDYHLEQGSIIKVEEGGSKDNFVCIVREYKQNDVASGALHAKIYKCEVTDPLSSRYNEGDEVRVDNRDVVRIMPS